MKSAVILAAGLSRRMQAFKPLLPYGGTTVVETTVSRLLEGNAEDIVIVTGFLAPEVRRVLEGFPVRFVHNRDYAQTQMFESVKLGLMAAEGEEIFVLPADLPEFDPGILEQLSCVQQQAVFPVCRGKNGHPLMLRRSAVERVLQHDGTRGLKGALDLLEVATVETGDEACLMDMDTPEDYRRLLEYRASSVPTRRTCEELFQRYGATDRIRAHCEAVCAVAMRLAEGRPDIDRKLLQVAARIHDAARKEAHHADVLADELERRGYMKLASVVRMHMDLPDMFSDSVSEHSLLYLADKLVIEDRETELEHRFSGAEARFADQPDILADIQRKRETAEKIWHLCRKA